MCNVALKNSKSDVYSDDMTPMATNDRVIKSIRTN